jgi:hypothetical protein
VLKIRNIASYKFESGGWDFASVYKVFRRLLGMPDSKVKHEIIVPFQPQDEGDECVIACCVMVLNWARGKWGEGIPELSYDDVKALLKKDADMDGLALNSPKLLNNCKALKKSKPRLQFLYSFSTGLTEIIDEIGKGYPVIAWLHQIVDGKPRNHSILIVDLSDDKMSIKFLDPLGDSKIVSVPTPEFLEQWGGTLNAQIRIHIPEDPLMYLPDYLENDSEDDKS